MKKGLLITSGIIAVGIISYVVYKKQVAPRFTVRNFSPTTMDGYFEWGKWSGPLSANAGPVAGWGWSGLIKSDPTKKQYSVEISKNGKPHSTITITDAGIYKI